MKAYFIFLSIIFFLSVSFSAQSAELNEGDLAKVHGLKLLAGYVKKGVCTPDLIKLKRQFQKASNRMGMQEEQDVRSRCQGSNLLYCETLEDYLRAMKKSKELWSLEGPKEKSSQYDYDDFFRVLIIGEHISNPSFFTYDGYKKIFLKAGDPEFPKSYPNFKIDKKLWSKYISKNCHVAVELAQMGRYLQVLYMELDGPGGLFKMNIDLNLDSCHARIEKIKKTMSPYYRASSNSDICKVQGDQKKTYCKGETPLGCLVY